MIASYFSIAAQGCKGAAGAPSRRSVVDLISTIVLYMFAVFLAALSTCVKQKRPAKTPPPRSACFVVRRSTQVSATLATKEKKEEEEVRSFVFGPIHGSVASCNGLQVAPQATNSGGENHGTMTINGCVLFEPIFQRSLNYCHLV